PHPVRFRRSFLRLPHDVPAIVAIRAAIRQHRPRLERLVFGKERDQMTDPATVDTSDGVGGVHEERAADSASVSGTEFSVDKRTTAPRMAAMMDPAKIPTLAMSPRRGSSNARAVTNKATVKPIPATKPKPMM